MDSLFGLGKKLRLRALSSGSVRVGRLCWRLTFRKGVWRRWWLVVLWPYSLAYFWLTRDALGAVARLERPVFGVARVRLGSEFNSHFLVAGMSGAGKSSFCKALAVELSRAGKSVCVLDVNGEYADCVRSVGGRVYATGSVGISLWELDGCSPVDRSAENCGILRRVLGLGDVQAIFLSRVVAAAYKAKGIREEDRASWGREPPVMADLLRACDALYAQRKDESLAGLRRRLEGLAATRVFGSKTVLPSRRRKPPRRSSSSVSSVILARTYSRPSFAQACSTWKVLPLPDRPEM